MAGELKVLRAEAGANAADPVLKQAAPATTAESTTARCAQEREQANWASVRGTGGPVAFAAGTGMQAEACGASCGPHGLASAAATATAASKWVCRFVKGSDSCHRRRNSAHVCRAAANAAAQDLVEASVGA